MASDLLTLRGKLPPLKEEEAEGISLYLVRGTEILSETKLSSQGDVALNVSREALARKSSFRLEAVVGPSGMGDQLSQVPQLSRIPLDADQLTKAERDFQLPLDKVQINADLRKLWGIFCRRYCVSGTVVGPDHCPAPFAEVQVFNVVHNSLGGYTKTLRRTVTADVNGHFTACFTWCTFGFRRWCWPCWPNWWLCWPWWWELDILRIIDHIEKQQIRPLTGVVAQPLPTQLTIRPLQLALKQPATADLLRGQGFVRSADEKLVTNPERTALIQKKLANPALRAIFPWWWWCCDDPNIVFTVRQNGQVILDENPAASTRWCLPNNSTVTLVGDEHTLSVCPGGPKPLQGFIWTRAGNTTIDHIHTGYADGTLGSDASDMAFTGAPYIYGEFAADPNPATRVAYYQVNAGQWAGNPARGGTPPVSSPTLSADLYNQVFIFHGLTSTFTSHDVKMGPFSHGGIDNLYATQEQRQSGAIAGLPPFPSFDPAHDILAWAFNGLKVHTHSSALIGGGDLGAVDLTVTAYNATFAVVPFTANPGDKLTLQIDNQPLVAHGINSLRAFTAANVEVHPAASGACPAYNVGPGGYVLLNVSVSDANGHLLGYQISTEFGHGSTGAGTPVRGYRQPGPFPPSPPYGPPDIPHKSFKGGTEDIRFNPAVDCCYDFRLLAGKRVTDGTFTGSEGVVDFQTATIKVT